MRIVKDAWDEPEHITYIDKRERNKGVGGTDLAGILSDRLGYKWASAFTVYCEKKGMHIDKKNKEIERGVERETRIKEWLQIRENYDVVDFRDENGFELSLKHREKYWLIASPDGLVFNNGKLQILEIKTTNIFQRKKWYKNGAPTVPDYYEVQVQWYMHLTRIKQALIVVEIDLWDAKDNREKIPEEERYERFTRVVEYNEKIGKYLEDAADRFWIEHVESDIEPKRTGAECEKAYMKKFFSEKRRVFLPTSYSLLSKLDVLQEEKKRVEKEIQELKEGIQEALRLMNADEGYINEYRVVLSRQERRGVDAEKLKVEHPDIWEECQKITYFESLKLVKENDNEQSN